MFWDLPWFAQFRSHTLVSGFVWQFRWTWQCTPRSIPCMSPLWTPTPETKIRLQVAEVWNGRVKLLWTLVHCSMTLTRAYIIHAYCFVAPAIICTVYCLRSILKRTGSICTNDFIAIFNRVYNIYIYVYIFMYDFMHSDSGCAQQPSIHEALVHSSQYLSLDFFQKDVWTSLG